MNYQQYRQLTQFTAPDPSLITADDLSDLTPRCLLRGYYPSGHRPSNLAVILCDDRVIRTFADDMEVAPLRNEDYVPSKRVYPDRSDFEFCRLLIERGVSIPFLGNSYPEERGEA